MSNQKIFFTQNSQKSERGITDEPLPPEPEVEPLPSVQEILDALGYYFKSRLDTIEAKLDECLKK